MAPRICSVTVCDQLAECRVLPTSIPQDPAEFFATDRALMYRIGLASPCSKVLS